MADAPHTSGPWLVDDEANIYAGPVHIATCHAPPFPNEDTSDWDAAFANAGLIAAAPDMLAALRDALRFVADQEDVSDGADGQQVPNRAMTLAQTLRAAITKAGGAA